MKRALLVLMTLLVPLQAAALDRDELLGLVAMPLAVNAVSNVTGVPADDLSRFVSTLNQAAVPPTQVVQVVRYVPVALVADDDPGFVDYVAREYQSGATGTRLVRVIEDRYRTYDLEPQFATLREPATTYVVRDDYVPPIVVDRVTAYQPVVSDTNDLLALAAMPLAVAAVSQLSGVPVSQLSSLVASLNNASLPPTQIVEVLRYVPVALVADQNEPRFVRYVEAEVDRGIRGPVLLERIDTRLRTYDVTPRFIAERPRTVIVDDDFFPTPVRTRVSAARTHPHGGPPGQLKKELGLQTGAEVVHGTKPGKHGERAVERTPRAKREREERVAKRHEQPQRRVVESQREPQRHPRAEKRDRPSKKQPAKMKRGGVERTSFRGNDTRGGHKAGRGHGNAKAKGKGKG